MKITKIRFIKLGIILIVFSFIFLKKDDSFSSINIDIETNGFRQYIDSTYILQSCDILEPYIKAEIISPNEYIGNIMKICMAKRAKYISTKYITDQKVQLNFEMPLSEVIYEFFESLKT